MGWLVDLFDYLLVFKDGDKGRRGTRKVTTHFKGMNLKLTAWIIGQSCQLAIKAGI